MSESNKHNSPQIYDSAYVSNLEEEIKRLKSEVKYKDYRMSWMLAQIRYLSDAMKNVRDIASDTVEEVQSMKGLAESNIHTGRYLKWDGKEIKYKGESNSNNDSATEIDELTKKRLRDEAYSDYKTAFAKNPNSFSF